MRYVNFMILLALLLGGCRTPGAGPSPQESPHQHQGHDHHAHHSEMEHGEPSDLSLYNLDAVWENQDGQARKLGEQKGKVVLVAMVYSSCQAACPRIIADMRAIESAVAERYPGRVKFNLVSIDPEVDTPDKLKQLALDSELSSAWELYRGDPEQVIELAAMLGVKYRKISETDFAHSNLITLLNADGEVVHQQVGLGVDPAETIGVIEKLLSP